jgi:methylmalonyl-CoA mutase C-terminal domain/subunit
MSRRIRFLMAKPDLDGHDRGAKVVALALRDAGMEVTYTGLHQSIEQIVHTAIEESSDVIGLSIMTGGHLNIARRLMDRLKTAGIADVKVVVGGVIPKTDIDRLTALGVDGVFPGGTPFDRIVSDVRGLFEGEAAQGAAGPPAQ